MRNKILKAITWINTISLIVSICMLDSDSYIPAVICIANLAWLGLFVLANQRGRIND